MKMFARKRSDRAPWHIPNFPRWTSPLLSERHHGTETDLWQPLQPRSRSLPVTLRPISAPPNLSLTLFGVA